MRKQTSRFWIAAFLALIIAAAPAAAQEKDPLRLDHTVVPTFQAIWLVVDADTDTYTDASTLPLGCGRRRFRDHARYLRRGHALRRVTPVGTGFLNKPSR